MIDVKLASGIDVVTMTHGKANALDTTFCDAIATKFHELKGSDAKAVVLTGQGKMFSAGVDLPRMVAGGAPYVREFLPALHRLYDAVFFHPKPVIAAVNGHAIAGGCVLACCADRRLMAKDGGRVGVTELQVGVPFPALAFEVMRFATVPRYLSEAILGAATYPPEQALERGFIDEIVAPDTLMDKALAAAQTLASLSPIAFAQSKMQIREGVSEYLARAGAATDQTVTGIWTAPATLDYMRRFVERTLKK
jgi:enoyl-CoA hydratase